MEAGDERNLEEARNAKMQKRPELDDYSEASVVEIDSDEEDESEFVWNESHQAFLQFEEDTSVNEEHDTTDLLSDDDESRNARASVINIASLGNSDPSFIEAGSEEKACSTKGVTNNRDIESLPFESRTNELMSIDDHEEDLVEEMTSDDSGCDEDYQDQNSGDESYVTVFQRRSFRPQQRLKRKLEKRCQETTGGGVSNRQAQCASTLRIGRKPSGQYKRNEDVWDAMFERLVRYKDTNGDTRVPKGDKGDPSLGNWVDRQRREYKKGKLLGRRKARLNTIGFEWKPPKIAVPNDRLWNIVYERLVKYKDANGHTRVPKRYKDDPRLGSWVVRQRYHYKKGKLSEQRQARLKCIGFEWKTPKKIAVTNDRSWNKVYERLVQYKDANGHTQVTKRYKDDPSLGNWVDKQRYHYRKGNLSDQRRARLKSIGFEWNPGKSGST